jgi:hypothetical protein
MIEKQRNCKAKQRKIKAYLKWKLLEMSQTQKKSWHWKPKLAQHNSTTKIIVCDVMFCEKKMLMITHNTMLQGEYINDNLHNNATTRHHEKDIDNEMQSKKLRC